MQGTFIQVKHHPDLVREVNGAIVNKNTQALEGARRQKAYVLEMKQKLEKTQTEVDSLRGQVSGMRSVMDDVLKRLNK